MSKKPDGFSNINLYLLYNIHGIYIIFDLQGVYVPWAIFDWEFYLLNKIFGVKLMLQFYFEKQKHSV